MARAMEWSPSKLIRVEKGEVGISTNDLKALLNYYGMKDETRSDELLELARSARGASFYDQFADLLKPGFKEYLAYEASASVIRQYDTVLVAGIARKRLTATTRRRCSTSWTRQLCGVTSDVDA